MRQVQECDIEPLITWWLLAVVLFFIVTYCVFIHPINHDVAWYLDESGRLLDGAKLYQDTVQFNPTTTLLEVTPPELYVAPSDG